MSGDLMFRVLLLSVSVGSLGLMAVAPQGVADCHALGEATYQECRAGGGYVPDCTSYAQDVVLACLKGEGS